MVVPIGDKQFLLGQSHVPDISPYLAFNGECPVTDLPGERECSLVSSGQGILGNRKTYPHRLVDRGRDLG